MAASKVAHLMEPKMTRSFHLTLLATLLASPALAADPVSPVFEPANFATPQPNPYISLDLGSRFQLTGGGIRDGKAIKQNEVQTVTGPGPMLLGVQTTQILDENVVDGRVIERTFDYYADDSAGNLWYFGEDVTNYEYNAAGDLTGTNTQSAWRAGTNGALPGISLPGKAAVGMSQMQEIAKSDGAMDFFEVVDADASLTGPGGSFAHVLKTYESSLSEPDSREFKYYGVGMGLLRVEDDLNADRAKPQLILDRPAG